mgnify:CR=1 FL=1
MCLSRSLILPDPAARFLLDLLRSPLCLEGKYPEAQAFQIHLRGQKDYLTPEGIRHCPAEVLLKELSA